MKENKFLKFMDWLLVERPIRLGMVLYLVCSIGILFSFASNRIWPSFATICLLDIAFVFLLLVDKWTDKGYFDKQKPYHPNYDFLH